jgi:hypothetical protein
MIMQSILLAVLYPRYYDKNVSSYRSGIVFSLLMGAFMFTTTTMANAAKINVTSMSQWFSVQIGFHLVQFLATGLMIGFVYREMNY